MKVFNNADIALALARLKKAEDEFHKRSDIDVEMSEAIRAVLNRRKAATYEVLLEESINALKEHEKGPGKRVFDAILVQMCKEGEIQKVWCNTVRNRPAVGFFLYSVPVNNVSLFYDDYKIVVYDNNKETVREQAD